MSETETPSRPCECNWPIRAVESLHFPVTSDDQMGEYHLQTIPNGHAIMRFCPWCGGAFPESKRDSFFTDPRDDEVAQLDALIVAMTDVEAMRASLGEPDHTIPSHPDNKQWICQYTYSSKWDSLELTVQETLDGKLNFSYGGKYIGEP